eukprot:159716-Pleurochrysis_carterae.AAC.1
MGPTGATAMADMLKMNATLTFLNVEGANCYFCALASCLKVARVESWQELSIDILWHWRRAHAEP